MPTFIHDGHSVFQSLAIIEYLDEIQPTPRLIPRDAKERAYARSLALMTIADAHPLTTPRVRNHLAKAFGADAKAIADWGTHWTTEGLATYERLLASRAPAPFALGSEPGLADICIGIRSSSRDIRRPARRTDGRFQTSRPSTLAALPPAIWASVASSMPLIPAMCPIGLYSAMSNG